jgi:hypothetical protein
MDAIKKMNKVNTILLAACLSLFVCVSLLIFSYVKLQQAYPLENLRGTIMQPVADNDKFLEFKGTYDRYVQCNMTTFDVHLYNTETQDVITLTPEHLAKPLPTLVHPGEGINTEFALFMPKTMYPGTWKPSFTGFYICHLGIFVDFKVQVVNPEAFIIQESNTLEKL